MTKKPAVFLDRDGTLNRDTDYTHRLDDLEMIPGAAQAVAHFSNAGYWVIILTNQSGLARGYFSTAAFEEFNEALLAQIALEAGNVDGLYFCPHHPDFTGPCDCRKPGIGMIDQARADFDIDMANSILIGDRKSDVEAAANAGLPGYLFVGSNLLEFCKDAGLIKNHD